MRTTTRIWNRFVLLILLLAASSPLGTAPARASVSDWPPIASDELAMKDNPASPGAAAMVLYREEIVNNKDFTEDYYYRIKIFTEDGKKRADVEVPFVKGYVDIKNIQARTIHPDGQVIPFDGKTLDKLLVKAGEVKVQAKTFTMPDVSAGSIIEYRYRIQFPSLYYLNSNWHVQEDLFTKRAHFVFIPTAAGTTAGLLWRKINLQDISPQQQKDGSWTLDVNDIVGLPEEDYMLPVDELRGRVEFSYTREEHPKEAKAYWDLVAKNWASNEETFIGKHSEVRDEATKTVATGDSPELMLRKLFARAQKIHNVDFDLGKTTQEAKRDDTKANSNVQDVLKRGSGNTGDVDRFFIAMAQAVGFDSGLVFVAPRSKMRFHPEMQDRSELSDYLVWVHAGDKDYFLDPGRAFCSFGMLPWYETNLTAMRPTKQGAVFMQIPAAAGENSATERSAQLKLDAEGNLSGTLIVRFTGQRAYIRRNDARNEDETGKNKMITDEIKGWLPGGAKFELTGITGWEGSDSPLEVQGKVRIPGVAESVGKRMLMPAGLYQAGHPQLLESAQRKQDVYFHYPYKDRDDITIQLPAGWKVETLPKPQVLDPGGQLKYELSATQDADTLHIQRSMVVGAILYPVSSYNAVRNFFSTAKVNDEQQLVLQASSTARN
jgi:Domain of Unknown Function with PDB structure (DUF3857)